MTGDFLICRIEEIEVIPDKQRIVKAKAGGETVIVSADTQIGQIGLLLDFESKLNPDFASRNNLFTDSELNADKTQVGYIKPDCRVRPKNFAKVLTTGFFLPLSSLDYTGGTFKEWQQANEVNGYKICEKYVRKFKVQKEGEPKPRKKIEIEDFRFHKDTPRMDRVQLPDGRFVLSRKQHGSSFIVSRLKVKEFPKSLERLDYYTKGLLEKVYSFFFPATFKDVVASRKIIKQVGEREKKVNHYYKSNIWTRNYKDNFEGKISDNTTFYGELIGYTEDGGFIQGGGSLKKIKDLIPEKYKILKEKYGDDVSYTYGCRPAEYSSQVYRITEILADGTVLDLSWEQIKGKCKELGLKTVPYLVSGVKKGRDFFLNLDELSQNDREVLGKMRGQDQLDWISENYLETEEGVPDHIPEGFCLSMTVGTENRISKKKSTVFRLLEQNGKESQVKDTEEEESLN